MHFGSCLYVSIEINNNKHVYRQSQVRMPNGSIYLSKGL